VIPCEDWAGWLLLLHAIVGGALVGVTTHAAWRLRGPASARQARMPQFRRLAGIAAVLFLLALTTGHLIFPTYQIRVRGEFLDSGEAVVAAHRNRVESGYRFWQRHYGGSGVVAPPPAVDPSTVEELPRRTARLGRWFDVKQHWAGLGAIAALVFWPLVAWWQPARDRRAVVPVVQLLAIGLALIAWSAALIGAIVTSCHSVAGFG
jgi:hypothetical protein